MVYRLQNATTTFRGGFGMIKTIYDIWEESTKSMQHVSGSTWSFSIQHFLWHKTKDESAPVRNSLGLGASDGDLVLFVVSASWLRPEDDHLVTSAAQKLIAKIDDATRKEGLYHPFKYLNYTASWQDPIGSYGDENMRRLRSVSRRYDPQGMFQEQHPGGFKL